MTVISTLNAKQRPMVIRTRMTVRQALNRIDNEPVRRARGLLRAIRTNPPDVIYLGDSMLSFVGAHDVDRRRLDTMVIEGLGPEMSVRVVDGPSFYPDLYDAILRMLDATSHRPLIVVPLCIRVRTTSLMEHPVHGHKKALRKLQEVDPCRATWRVRGAWPKPTKAEFEEYYRVPYSTLLGDWTVGDYLRPIADFQRSGDEESRLKMLYAYHHGGLLTAVSPGIEAVTRMGRTIRELGCPAVVYQSPVPVETGTALLGPELADRTAESFAVLNAAYRLGAGENAEIIESGTLFAESEFIDPSDATEHLNEFGRRRLAKMIVDSVKRNQAPN